MELQHGRFSSNSPNLQQIPSRGEAKEIRRIFGASKGNVLLSSDFSQQEPRTLASLANEQQMIDAYLSGKDLYATMASQIYHKPYGDCMEFYLDENGKKTDKTNPEGKKRRSSVKSILLGECTLCSIKMVWTNLLLGVKIKKLFSLTGKPKFKRKIKYGNPVLRFIMTGGDL